MKTPKPPSLYDVCIMQVRDGIVYHTATPNYNLPYVLASRLAKAEIVKHQKSGKGFYYILTPNGKKPLTQLKLNLNG